MRTRRKSRFSRVYTPHQQLATVNRRTIAVNAETNNPLRDLHQQVSQVSRVNLTNPAITPNSNTNRGTPTGVYSEQSYGSGGSINPRRLTINMENNRPGSSSQIANVDMGNSHVNQVSRSRNSSGSNASHVNVANGETSGNAGNSMLNARDGLLPFNADASQNVGVPENRTPIQITRESVLTNLTAEFFQAMTAARNTWLNSRREILDANSINFFDRWEEEGSADEENSLDELTRNALNEHVAYVENLRKNKREAIREQNRSQFYNVAHFNTPNEAVDLRQPVAPRPSSLEIPRQMEMQSHPNAYQVPHRRSNLRGSTPNHVSSAASNDGNWRNNADGHLVKDAYALPRHQQLPAANNHDNAQRAIDLHTMFRTMLSQGTVANNPQMDSNANQFVTEPSLASVHRASSHLRGHSAWLGNQQAVYNMDTPARNNANDNFGNSRATRSVQSQLPMFSGTSQQHYQSTPVQNFGPQSTAVVDRHHLKSFDIPKYSGFGDKKTPYDFLADLERYMQISGIHPESLLQRVIPTALVDDAFFWYNMEMSWDPFESWDQFKLRFRQQFQPVDYDRTLKRELDDRYQGPDESLSFFLRVIAGYYYRLGIQSDSKIIERVCEQMHPSYKRHIRDARLYQTLAHFKKAVEHADICVQAEQKYKAPVPGKSIEPLLAYNPRMLPETKPSGYTRNQFSAVPYTRTNDAKKQVSFPNMHTQPPQTMSSVLNKESENVAQPQLPITAAAPIVHENTTFPQQQDKTPRSRSPSPGRNFSGCFNCKGNHFARDCPHPNPNPQSPSPLNSNSLGPQKR